ncbi:MAG: LPXTG-site transpeptidase (sortase) family protein [Candidatus Paceibacteria bacterium]|jgi:LPXTG-site transpeptidase (sortase) family protein
MPKETYKKGQVFSALNTGELMQYVTVVLVVFSVVIGTLYTIGVTPESFKPVDPVVDITFGDDEERLDFIKEVSDDDFAANSNTTTLPEHISIPTIGVDSQIEHPNSQDILTLDNALKKGAVYYPGSGSLEEGNVFLFGHSSNWKVVQNQAYKVFNDLDKLQKGETITLEAKGYQYVYKVDRVSLVDENEAFVSFDNTKNTLTISTCNTFGAKQERWVVEATFFQKKVI